MKIIAISGSLKPNGYNAQLLKAAVTYLPGGSEFQLLSADLPLYSEALEGDHLPTAVTAFKAAINEADALMLASPEYNHHFSGVIKNALDWASRPAFESPLKGKKAAVMSASPSPLGGIRAQDPLRQVLIATLTEVYPGLQYSLPAAHTAFDDEGKLVDETAQRRLARFMEGFISWINA